MSAYNIMFSSRNKKNIDIFWLKKHLIKSYGPSVVNMLQPLISISKKCLNGRVVSFPVFRS